MSQSQTTNPKTKGYHRLNVVTKTKTLIKLIYQHTNKFPKTETFGITSQIRRAGVSVLLNIVEGDRRASNKEFYRFLNMAEASLAEVEACLEISLDLEMLKEKDYKVIEEQRQKIAFMLSSLSRKVKSTLK